jgi:Asp-tRNA(Asn)/Glu-tRNA(Gln) amidotransferase A subunit family amidase
MTAAGLPIGLQIVGPARGDMLVLRATRASSGQYRREDQQNERLAMSF